VSSRRNILLIEDRKDAREALRVYLEISGHRVAAAADGPQGLDMAQSFKPDVVVVDIGLPGLDGYQVAEHFRRMTGPNGPSLIALTGYDDPEVRRRVGEAGFDSHFAKPVDLAALSRTLAATRPVAA
jgi:CheY-like chemotaxis protein